MVARVTRRLRRYWPPRGSAVVFAHEFRQPPYGGSNQFLLALRAELRRRGHGVGENRITSTTRACLLNAFLFDERVLSHAALDAVRVVHRVDGPLAAYRGFDDGMDERIATLNERYAQATVFQSQYSLDATRALGLELRRPVLIPNAADPAIFHPGGARQPGDKVRLIATSWSDNENKGFDTYAWLDRNLDRSRYEFTFVGRSPIRFEHARVIPPVHSRDLADLLRKHDVFVTASRNDPCSNSLLEALACGLPAVYLQSGGHPELVREAGRGFSSQDELLAAVEEVSAQVEEYRQKIVVESLNAVADKYLEVMGLGTHG